MTAAWVNLGCVGGAALLVLLVVPESLPPSVARTGALRISGSGSAAAVPQVVRLCYCIFVLLLNSSSRCGILDWA
jgi:hypothetical protein